MDTRVFVISITGQPLMPTTPQKARKLLKKGKAFVCNKIPFTIKLKYKTGCTTQPLVLGVDTGSEHIGIGICRKENNKAVAIYAAEIQLRSSIEKRQLMEARKEFRRSRRYRKIRYRKPKFKHSTKRIYSDTPVIRKTTKNETHWIKVKQTYNTKPLGWLAPSVQSKIDHHINWINKYLNILPSSTKLRIETGRFDMAKMKDPTVHNELYQNGQQYDYENVKAFIFDRDKYTCQCCGAIGGSVRKNGKTVKLVAHHVLLKAEGATNNPEYMATVCDNCHTLNNHKPGGVLYKWFEENKRFSRGLRDASQMNTIYKFLMTYFPDAIKTYGNITSADRKMLLLEKSHANDAIAIAAHGYSIITGNPLVILFKQVRKKKRSLHEANPRKGKNSPNIQAIRNAKNTKFSKGFSLYDKVCNKEFFGWITGFASRGSAAYIKDKNGIYIPVPGKTYLCHPLSSLTRKTRNNTWIIIAIKPIRN